MIQINHATINNIIVIIPKIIEFAPFVIENVASATIVIIIHVEKIILYIVFGWDDGKYFISALDIVISVYIAMKMGKDSFKEKLILFSLEHEPYLFWAELILTDLGFTPIISA